MILPSWLSQGCYKVDPALDPQSGNPVTRCQSAREYFLFSCSRDHAGALLAVES
jgi:hypothetical protein